MNRIGILLVLLSLISIPTYAQSISVKGKSPAAELAKTQLAKDTRYKLSEEADHATLVVRQESWSTEMMNPATTAIHMELVSGRGKILWSKTEPVGQRTTEAVVQDMLKELAKAKPKID